MVEVEVAVAAEPPTLTVAVMNGWRSQWYG